MILRLADRVIRVNNLYPYIESYCAGYICDDCSEAVDFIVDITEDDIAFERQRTEKEARAAQAGDGGYLETLAVYRKIAERMPEYDTVLFHGSAVAVDGEGYLFTAKSGTGKSTHTRLWREYFGERAVMVNDDKPLIRVSEDGAYVYGTPWNGKHRLGANISVPLRGLCALERAAYNSITPADGRELYSLLMQQTYRPRNAAALSRTLTLIDRLADSVRLYTLRCNMDPRAAQISYLGMQQ